MMAVAVAVESSTRQRDRALEIANRVRSARAELKRQVKAGERDLAGVLLDPPAAIASAKIGDVVEWAPGVGEWRAKQILLGAQVGPTRRVDLLTPAARERVVERLRELGPQR